MKIAAKTVTVKNGMEVGAFLQELIDSGCCFGGTILVVQEEVADGAGEKAATPAQVDDPSSHVYDMFRNAKFPGAAGSVSGFAGGGGAGGDAILMDNNTQ